MTIIFGSLPATPNPGGASSSLPGTPLSGISTVAIKDGHEGSRHSNYHGEYVPSSERLARLGGLGVTDRDRGGGGHYGGSNISTGEGTSYFDRVSGWRKEVGERNPTWGSGGSGSGGGCGSGLGDWESPLPSIGRSSSTDGSTDSSVAGSNIGGGWVSEDSRNGYLQPQQSQSGETQNRPNTAGLAGNSRAPPGRVSLPPPPTPARRAPSSYSGLPPAPPCPTPNTPSIQVPLSGLPSRSSILSSFVNVKEREGSSTDIIGTIGATGIATTTPTNTPATTSPPPTQSNLGPNQPFLSTFNNSNTIKDSSSTSNGSLSAPTSSSISTPAGAPSPASTATTASVRQEKDRARMIGPMTYDEGVIDTTNRSPMRVDNEDDISDVYEDVDPDTMEGVEAGNARTIDVNGTDSGSTPIAEKIPGFFVEGRS